MSICTESTHYPVLDQVPCGRVHNRPVQCRGWSSVDGERPGCFACTPSSKWTQEKRRERAVSRSDCQLAWWIRCDRPHFPILSAAPAVVRFCQNCPSMVDLFVWRDGCRNCLLWLAGTRATLYLFAAAAAAARRRGVVVALGGDGYRVQYIPTGSTDYSP